MNEKEIIKSELKQLIERNPESFPFIAQYWEIKIKDKTTLEHKWLELGKYNSKQSNSNPFYKPISRMIDLSKIN
jgi:hypothetical protein